MARSELTKPLHEQLHDNSGFDHLFKSNADDSREEDIGLVVRRQGRWLKRHGTISKGAFVIGSLQKNYRGEVCYRVYSVMYNDTFGSVLGCDEVVFMPMDMYGPGY